MHDTWQSGNPYDYFMGRWSKLVAEQFVDWLSPDPGCQWLDVGCGSGALSEAVIDRHAPKAVIAIDQSDGFVRTTQQRLGSNARCIVGNALALPFDNTLIDIAVSGLVLNFISEPEKALKEMRRVTRKGGVVAIYVWDYAGKMELLNHFWDAVVEINPHASGFHEGHRFQDWNTEQLFDVFNRAGFSQVEVTPIEVLTHFKDFDDYWRPFLGGQGPAPTYISKLGGTEINHLRKTLAQRLPIDEDGSIELSARAWATKGIV